jgi:integrase
MWLDNGVPLRETMRIMGHTDPKITLTIYDSVSPKQLKDVSKDISVFKNVEFRKKFRNA